MKDTVQKKIEEERKRQSPRSSPNSPNDVTNMKEFDKPLNKVDNYEQSKIPTTVKKTVRSEHYVSDDETLSYDDR